MGFIKPSNVVGTMELLPNEQILFDNVKDIIEDTFKKHGFLPIDTPVFEKNEILIEQALDKFGNVKSTKGNKKTLFKAPKELMNILTDWKIEQKKQLKLFGIRQNEKQFVFTYNNRTNGINVPLHIDYLNHRMNSIRRRHPELPPASPHKLRHTGATLARQAGTSLNAISEALTHSDIQITKTYVNTTETVNQTAGEIAFRSLKKQ